jgi:hypothetical protein
MEVNQSKTLLIHDENAINEDFESESKIILNINEIVYNEEACIFEYLHKLKSNGHD